MKLDVLDIIDYLEQTRLSRNFTNNRLRIVNDKGNYEYSLAGLFCEIYLAKYKKKGRWINESMCIAKKIYTNQLPEPVFKQLEFDIGRWDAYRLFSTLLKLQSKTEFSFYQVAQVLKIIFDDEL